MTSKVRPSPSGSSSPARANAACTSPSRRRRRAAGTVRLTSLAVDALTRHRTAQKEEKLRLGSLREDQDLVFASVTGEPLDAGNLMTRSFYPLLKRTTLPKICFHDLRHTCATLLLTQNVNPKIVQEMLDHANISETMDTYSHVLPTMQDTAVNAMEKVLAQGL